MNSEKKLKWVGFNTANKNRIDFAFTDKKYITAFLDYQTNTFKKYIYYEPGVSLITFYTLEQFFKEHPKNVLMLNPIKKIDFNKPVLS